METDKMNLATSVMTVSRKGVHARDVIAIGKHNNCTFVALPFRGVIDKPKGAIGWVYIPFDQDDTRIPQEGIRRMRMLRTRGVRACQVIIGHEIKVAETKEGPDHRMRPSPLMIAGAIGAVTLGAVVLSALAVPTAVTAAVVAPAAVPAVSTMGAVGFLAGAVMVDPACVIVLEGSEEWVQVFSWVED